MPDSAQLALVSLCGNHVKNGDVRPRVTKDAASETPVEFHRLDTTEATPTRCGGGGRRHRRHPRWVDAGRAGPGPAIAPSKAGPVAPPLRIPGHSLATFDRSEQHHMDCHGGVRRHKAARPAAYQEQRADHLSSESTLLRATSQWQDTSHRAHRQAAGLVETGRRFPVAMADWRRR